jgi:hypothetical protein
VRTRGGRAVINARRAKAASAWPSGEQPGGLPDSIARAFPAPGRERVAYAASGQPQFQAAMVDVRWPDASSRCTRQRSGRKQTPVSGSRCLYGRGVANLGAPRRHAQCHPPRCRAARLLPAGRHLRQRGWSRCAASSAASLAESPLLSRSSKPCASGLQALLGAWLAQIGDPC